MAEKKPWTQLSRQQVYQNPWMTVFEDQVINPGGGENLYGVVHFRNTAVGIIPCDSADNTWLVGQHRYTTGSYSWEIPSGGQPLGQDTLDGAQRELQEETGLRANSWSVLARLHTSNSITDESGIIYQAQDLVEGEPDFDETEDISIRKLPLVEAREMVMQGRITDAISIIAILKLAALRLQG